VDPSWRSIPYGTPIANNEYRILSAELRPRPVWVTGELYCAGVGLARGYLGEPERTAESFVADPVTGQRMYRTGDLGRYLPDGTIEFIGRADARVKVRGQRIEPGEIEAALASHPRVTTAAVVAVPYPDRPGHRALAGFVTPADGAWPSTGELRAHLRERLPEHLVPATLRTLQRFPLTANGKVDRAALVRMAGDHPVAPTPPPETELDALEHLLATVWEQTLAMPVGKDDDFFALGGDSLQATRILSRLAEIFEGEDLPLRTLFSSPTVAGMARAFRDAQRAAGRLDAIARIHLDVELLSPDQVDKALLEAATGHPDADRGGDR
jgi:yersiniabactin nonribosomal peptide synthetase